MSTNWADASWNENGELVLGIYAEPPIDENEEGGHTYATVDCGGDCGECIALIVDGEVVSGPPFHKNCGCELSDEDIDNAEEQKSNLLGEVGPNRNTNLGDAKWLKESLDELGFYEPDERAGETAGNPNTYPNKNMFNAIEKFQKANNMAPTKNIKPGHWEEIKIKQELKKYNGANVPAIKERLFELGYYKPDIAHGETPGNFYSYPNSKFGKAIERFQEENQGIPINKITEEKSENLMNLDEKFEALMGRTRGSEGGYEDRPNRIDQTTNMGIIQETLNSYNRAHPEAGFPSNLHELTREQADQIYREVYYDNKRINEINDLRVAYAVMDMGVMTSPGNVANIVQSTVNEVIGYGTVAQDRVMGIETIGALNNIPASRRDEFMRTLIQNRMEFLRNLPTWNQYSGGWTARTKGYMEDF